MGVFDWLALDPNLAGGKTVNNISPTTGVPAAPGFSLTSLLADPNMQQLLAQMGSRIGGPGSAGEVIGVPTSQAIRSQQMAKAVEKQDQSFMGQMIRALGGGNLADIPVTPQGDRNGVDSLSVNDKGVTIKLAPLKMRDSYGSDKPLESQTKPAQSMQTPVQAPVSGGQDLRPFFSSLLG